MVRPARIDEIRAPGEPKVKHIAIRRSSASAVAALLVSFACGCSTGPLVIDPGHNLHPSTCVVPVRARIRAVTDRRRAPAPTEIGVQKSQPINQLGGRISAGIVTQRPPAEMLNEALSKTLHQCAPPDDHPTPVLTLDVDLATFELTQITGRDYRTESKMDAAFSVRVFDAEGAKFLESFDVRSTTASRVELGMVPTPEYLVDQALDDAANRFTWEFVPAIRNHGS